MLIAEAYDISRLLLKSFALPLGVLLHFLEDMLASDFNTLLYPLTLINIGLGCGDYTRHGLM